MSRFDFGKKNENCNEAAFKQYFKENNFFGLQPYTVNFEAKEFVVFTHNIVVNAEDERKRVELLYKTRKECDYKFPYSIGIQFDVVFYTQKTKDFAVYIPNKKAIYLYLFRTLEDGLKHCKPTKTTK